MQKNALINTWFCSQWGGSSFERGNGSLELKYVCLSPFPFFIALFISTSPPIVLFLSPRFNPLHQRLGGRRCHLLSPFLFMDLPRPWSSARCGRGVWGAGRTVRRPVCLWPRSLALPAPGRADGRGEGAAEVSPSNRQGAAVGSLQAGPGPEPGTSAKPRLASLTRPSEIVFQI